MVSAAAPAFEPRQPRSGGPLTWRYIISSLIVAGLVGLGGYVYGLGSHDAVKTEQISNMQLQIIDLQANKVSKEQFSEFQKSVDDLKAETRALREELGKTREALLQLSARR